MGSGLADDSAAIPTQSLNGGPPAARQEWNWHLQNTDIVQYHPGFSARYSGPNSLTDTGDVKETVSLDLMFGARLWPGAELHLDGLVWQGYGFNKTLGAEGFPNGEAFRLGNSIPNAVFSRVFIRQTIGLGGETEATANDALHLAGQSDVSRLTITAGKFSAKDIFDNNAYANDPRTQFMNWSLMANEAWDYPADSLGFITGLAVELNESQWTARYGFFQVPRVSNGIAEDPAYLDAWSMVAEFERRFSLGGHPGAARVLTFLTRAHMGSYELALDDPSRPADVAATRDYRYKFGFGLNLEQEFVKGVGGFLRLGWSDGRNEGWSFSDVDHSASLGVSLNGNFWRRPEDTLGIAAALNGISGVHREFLAAGGTGILAGDGALTYATEKLIETYYDIEVWKGINLALDYQFIADPAFNRDRGPVSVVSGRLHWSF